MKLKNLFYLLLAMPLAFAACNETPDVPPTPDPEPSFTLTSDATMEFEAQGGEGTITFVYDFTDVNEAMVDIECAADWIEVADQVQASAASFTFAVAENEAEDAREAVVRATIGNLYFEVTVKQEGKKETPKTPVFELVSEDVMELSQEQQFGTIKFNLENRVSGVAVSVKSNQSWVNSFNVREADGEIAFVVDANNGAAREAKITATYGMLEFKVTVKQAEYVAPAPVLEITSTLEPFAFEGGEGVLAYVLENAVEGVELQATADVEWITITSAANGVVEFTVAKNETSSQRGGNITLTYGEVSATAKVEQLFDGYDPSITYGVFTITEVRANAISNDTWNLILFEHDPILGEMYTRITVKLPKANAQYITDGTYSVADGTIIPNNSADTGSGSYYRYNGNGLSIYDAELTISIDKENETAKFNGVFKVAGGEYTFAWDGAVNGFVYQDLDAGITEWDYFYIYSHWDDTKYVVAYSGGIRFDWYLKKLGGKKSDPVAAGTYVVSDWESTTTKDYVDSSATKINGVPLQNGGVVTITEVAEGLEFTFDVTDVNGTNWKGTYVGTIEPNLYYNPYAN